MKCHPIDVERFVMWSDIKVLYAFMRFKCSGNDCLMRQLVLVLDRIFNMYL